MPNWCLITSFSSSVWNHFSIYLLFRQQYEVLCNVDWEEVNIGNATSHDKCHSDARCHRGDFNDGNKCIELSSSVVIAINYAMLFPVPAKGIARKSSVYLSWHFSVRHSSLKAMLKMLWIRQISSFQISQKFKKAKWSNLPMNERGNKKTLWSQDWSG